MNKKLEIGWMFALCMVLWVTEQMTGWFSAHFPSWFFQTVWGDDQGHSPNRVEKPAREGSR